MLSLILIQIETPPSSKTPITVKITNYKQFYLFGYIHSNIYGSENLLNIHSGKRSL